MANDLGYYNPVYYANQALMHLENALGMAEKIHRGYDEERRAFDKGDTIKIRKPSTFTVQDAPGSTPQDLEPGKVDLTLQFWKEVTFALTDKEMAFSEERIIDEHIQPATYQLANWVDVQLCNFANSVPWFTTRDGTPDVVKDLTLAHKGMFDLGAPMGDPSRLHFMMNGLMQANALQTQAFTQQQGAGDQGVAAQRTGIIGPKFGFNIFANQNVPTFTRTTVPMADQDGTIVGAHAKGATSLSCTAFTVSITDGIMAGDSLVVAGNTQRYTVTATVSTGVSGEATVAIAPALTAALVGGEVVTLHQLADGKSMNLLFHRNFSAIAFAKLPDGPEQNKNASIVSLQHPRSNVAIRVMMWYDPNTKKNLVSFDILCGFVMLDYNLAHRVEEA